MSKAKTMQVEVWVMVDQDGCSAVAGTAADAANDFHCTHGEPEAGHATRMVKVVLTIPVPAVAEVAVTVPAEAAPTAAVS